MARSRTPKSNLPMVPIRSGGGDRCPIDGGELQAGFCPIGNGYPYWTLDEQGEWLRRPCPFACPLCRALLQWDGGCQRCFGVLSPGGPWTFPGDRYDRWDDQGRELGDGAHWIKTDGPRDAVSRIENAENLRILQRVLAAMPEIGRKPKRWF